MRKFAYLKQQQEDVKRVMIYDCGKGVYVFLFRSEEDGPCNYDYYYDTIAEADKVCFDDYGISTTDWQPIPDPLPGCQDDWIRPTRVKRNEAGAKLFGQFEPADDLS